MGTLMLERSGLQTQSGLTANSTRSTRSHRRARKNTPNEDAPAHGATARDGTCELRSSEIIHMQDPLVFALNLNDQRLKWSATKLGLREAIGEG